MITAALMWAMQEMCLLLGILCTAGWRFGLLIRPWLLLPAVCAFGLSVKCRPLVFLGALGILLPGLSAAERVTAALCLAKTVYDAYKGRCIPDTETVRRTMGTLVKVYAVLFVIVLFMEESSAITGNLLFCAALSLCAGLILLRTLRHDAAVYDQPVFQLVNILSLSLAVLLGSLLSSPAALRAAGSLLSFFWNRLLLPALTLITWTIALPLLMLGRLLDRLNIGFGHPLEETMEIIFEETQGMHFENYEVTVRDRISLFIPLMIVLVLVVLVMLYRHYRSVEPVRQADAPVQTTEEPSREEGITGRSDAVKVRRIYRKYLQRAAKKQIRLEPADTSLRIQEKTGRLWPEDTLKEMRSIYLRARYRDKASRKDVSRMKELYAQIKRNEREGI